MRRHLLVGVVVAAVAAALAFSNTTLNLQHLWTLLVGAAVVLVPVRTLAGRLGAFATGLVAGWGAFALRAAVLPDIPAGRALIAAIPVVLVTLVATVTVGRLPLWAGLAGLATFVGAYDPVFVASPTDFIEQSVTTLTSVLLLVCVGALVAMVASPAVHPEPAPTVREPSGNGHRPDEVVLPEPTSPVVLTELQRTGRESS